MSSSGDVSVVAVVVAVTSHVCFALWEKLSGVEFVYLHFFRLKRDEKLLVLRISGCFFSNLAMSVTHFQYNISKMQTKTGR